MPVTAPSYRATCLERLEANPVSGGGSGASFQTRTDPSRILPADDRNLRFRR